MTVKKITDVLSDAENEEEIHMNRKSIAQEYFALAVDKNGNMPPLHRDEANAGLVAAGFMDLLINEIIKVEKKKITVIKDIPQELQHIESLYTYLNGKSCSIDKLMMDYYAGKKIRQLTSEVGKSLFEDGVASAGSGGIFVSETTYIPEKCYREDLVRAIKSALVNNDEITSHDVALIVLLQKTKNLNQYFSKQESEDVKDKLKEIKTNPQNKQLAEMVEDVSSMTLLILATIFMYYV